jgi:hypothetical protein
MTKILIVLVVLLYAVSAWSADTLQLTRTAFIASDAVGVKIKQPEGVGCRGNSTLAVSDTANGRIQLYSLADDGSIKPGIEIKVPYPLHVRLNSKGDILVLDGRQRRLMRMSASGESLGYFEPKDMPDAKTWIPKNFAIDGEDNVYILDIFSARVIIVGRDGKFLKQIALPDTNGFFSDVTVDPQGTIFLLNSVNATIFTAAKNATVFSPVAKQLKEFVTFPTAILADNKYLFLVDQNGSGIVAFGKDGSFKGRKIRMGWKNGELQYPSDMCLNERGQVFVADRGNNLIEVYKMSFGHE